MKGKINNNIMDRFPPVLYLQLVGSIFTVTGFGLFFYCILFNFNIAIVEVYSNPLFYLGVGFSCILFSFFVKKYGLEVDG